MTHSKKIFALGYLVFCTVMMFGLAGSVKAEDKKFGEECSNFTCASGECEESNSENEAYKGKKYCTCDEASDCLNEFSAKAGEIWSCDQKDSFNLHYCKSNIPGSDHHAGPGATQYSTWNGVTQSLTDDEIRKMISKPSLRIKIPGLKFTDPTGNKEDGGTYLFVNYIGEYVRALYRYAIAVAAILAVIMIIKAGFMWTASGGSSEVISKQKETIEKAIVGLIIAVSSYTILFAINPKLVQFNSLKVEYVKGIPGPDYFSTPDDYNGDENSTVPGTEALASAALDAAKGHGCGKDIDKIALAMAGEMICQGPNHCANFSSRTLVLSGCDNSFLVSGVTPLRNKLQENGWTLIKGESGAKPGDIALWLKEPSLDGRHVEVVVDSDGSTVGSNENFYKCWQGKEKEIQQKCGNYWTIYWNIVEKNNISPAKAFPYLTNVNIENIREKYSDCVADFGVCPPYSKTHEDLCGYCQKVTPISEYKNSGATRQCINKSNDKKWNYYLRNAFNT